MNCRPHAVRSRRDRARRICAKSPEMCADRVRQKESERQVQMLEAMLESNGVVRRMCYVRTSCGCSFRPTRAGGVQELCWLSCWEPCQNVVRAVAARCGRWPRMLRKLPSGACGGQFNGPLATLGYEAQRVAGLHRRLRWTQASLAHRRRFGSAKCGSRMHILQNLPQRRLRWKLEGRCGAVELLQHLQQLTLQVRSGGEG